MNKVVAGDYLDNDAFVIYDKLKKCYCIRDNNKRLHQKIDVESIVVAYQCGQEHSDGSQDIYLAFKFSEASCTINLSNEYFDEISKVIKIEIPNKLK